MSVYRVLPCITSCKLPIPHAIDIFVMVQTETQQQIEIRIPLDMISNIEENDGQFNIRFSDIKPVILTLFKRNGVFRMINGNRLNTFSTVKDFRLCWRGISAEKPGKNIASESTNTPITGNSVEWINDHEELVGPQLIEQVR